MNRTIRNVVIAAPFAVSALAVTPGVAMAAQPGPVDVIAQPQPDRPQGPGDITNPEPDPTTPDGPGDITNPDPCPTHGVDCTPGDQDEPNGGGDGSGGGGAGDDRSDATRTVLPTRIDAGVAPQSTEGDLDLVWLLGGGLAVTAMGAAFAARVRTRTTA